MRRATHHPRSTGDADAEAGFVGGGEVLPFGVLIFVVGTLLMVNAWAVVDAKLVAQAAARETARSYVESDGSPEALDEAKARGREAVSGMGRNGKKLKLLVDAPVFDGCAPVTVTARYPVPSVHLPFLGGFGRTFDVTARHREIVDPLRSGISHGDCGY